MSAKRKLNVAVFNGALIIASAIRARRPIIWGLYRRLGGARPRQLLHRRPAALTAKRPMVYGVFLATKRGGFMPRNVVIEEFHVTLLVPRRLSVKEAVRDPPHVAKADRSSRDFAASNTGCGCEQPSFGGCVVVKISR